MRPALRVPLGLLRGEPVVLEGHPRAAVDRLDGDRDRRGVGRQVGLALPAEPEDHAPTGLDLAVCACGDVAGVHRPAVGATGPQVHRGGHGQPAPHPFRLGDQREGLVGRDRQVDGLGAGGHRVLLKACASATSRSSSSVQNLSISACSCRSPLGRTR